jgi:putative transposase
MIPHRDWPHAPSHRWTPGAAYIVTGATIDKQHFLKSPEHLSTFRNLLFEQAELRGWSLQAWAILINHYHFVALAPDESANKKAAITTFIRALHSKGSIAINKLDGVCGRKVFYQYWDTELIYAESYFSRLHYVHANPEKHGVSKRAEDYPWCSMAWFKTTADRAFCKSVLSFKTDTVKMFDDF